MRVGEVNIMLKIGLMMRMRGKNKIWMGKINKINSSKLKT